MITLEKFHVHSGKDSILHDINHRFHSNCITAIVGPSGSGKSTLLRSLNRMLKDNLQTTGKVIFNEDNIYDLHENAVPHLRKNIGMVFQKPTVFCTTIYKNVAFGLQHVKRMKKDSIQSIIEEKIKDVGLWEEVKNRLHTPALNLSIGQQQRLCIARAMTMEPQILLLDEPTSALDYVSTEKINTILMKQKSNYTIILVTHDLAQAEKIADNIIRVENGKII